MRKCHVCQAMNEDDAPRCTACNARLRKRERANMEQSESPFSEKADPVNRPAVRAFFLALWGMIPLLGLILGPVSALLGWYGKRMGRTRPGFSAEGPARAAMLLGSAETVTQWAGLALIYLSWYA